MFPPNVKFIIVGTLCINVKFIKVHINFTNFENIHVYNFKWFHAMDLLYLEKYEDYNLDHKMMF
jgi:hypothetical protein